RNRWVQGFLSVAAAAFLSFKGRPLPACVHLPFSSEPSLLISASYRPPTIFTPSVSLESFCSMVLTGISAPPWSTDISTALAPPASLDILKTRCNPGPSSVPSQVPRNSFATAGLAFISSTLGSPVRVSWNGKVPGPCVKSPFMVLPSDDRVPVKVGSQGAPFMRNVHFPFVKEMASSGMPDAFWAGMEIEPIQPLDPLSRSTSTARVWLGRVRDPLQ